MKNLFSVFVPLYVANIRILTICSKFLELFWENSSFYSFTVLQFWKTFFFKMPQRKFYVITERRIFGDDNDLASYYPNSG